MLSLGIYSFPFAISLALRSSNMTFRLEPIPQYISDKLLISESAIRLDHSVGRACLFPSAKLWDSIELNGIVLSQVLN